MQIQVNDLRAFVLFVAAIVLIVVAEIVAHFKIKKGDNTNESKRSS